MDSIRRLAAIQKYISETDKYPEISLTYSYVQPIQLSEHGNHIEQISVEFHIAHE